MENGYKKNTKDLIYSFNYFMDSRKSRIPVCLCVAIRIPLRGAIFQMLEDYLGLTHD
jgi:hypothetical protein